MQGFDGAAGEQLSEGEDIGEVCAEGFIYRLVKVIS